MRVCFVNCRQDGVDETPLLRNMLTRSRNPGFIVVADPAAADLILITGILEKNTFASLRANRIWQQYPEKSFGYSEVDNVPSFLHGVYASASRFKGLFNRMQSGGYPGHRAWRPNSMPPATFFHETPKLYLFSFIGRKSHSLRKRLFRVTWPGKDVFVADRTGEYEHFKNPDQNREKLQAVYWKVMAQSKFVLCPRGAGASSIRTFESMQAGVAPVIISDAWLPAAGPVWKEFAIFVPERKIHQLYDILKSHESEWMERGKLAEAAYHQWFTEGAAWGQLLAAIQTIRTSQTLPEKWFVRGRRLIYVAELIHEWRHKLPVRIKKKLLWLKTRKT